MPTPATSTKKLQEALNIVTEYGSGYKASHHCDIPAGTLANRAKAAIAKGLVPEKVGTESDDKQLQYLENKVKILTRQLEAAERKSFSAKEIQDEILRFKNIPREPADWLVNPTKKSKHYPEVPFLWLSDWHWGEVIEPSQVGDKNHYNMRIASERVQTLTSNVIDLLQNHSVRPDYPGIVIGLGGDIVAGTIHEELEKTNEKPIMPVVQDAIRNIIRMLDVYLEHFPNVFVAGVVGNHGRTTRKPSMKNRAFENYEWLIYQIVADHYHGNKNIQFYIPDGTDALVKIFDTTYCLTHGDQFRGGDSIIGAAGPILRGDNKKRSRQSQVGQDYDVMVCGHWHQVIITNKVIVGPCLSGYDEYAYINNFSFEEPGQLMWLNHPTRGISRMYKVHVNNPKKKTLKKELTWVSFLDHNA